MKVVQVLPALASGGVERGTLEVAEYLVEKGHQSYVISAGGRLVQQLTDAGSEHITWPLGKKSIFTFRHVLSLRKWLSDNQIDIIHVRSRMPAWICYLAWKGMSVEKRPKLITTVHGPYSVNRYSAVMTKGERVIVISRMIEDYVLKNYPEVEIAKLRLNYRGVDPTLYNVGYQPSQVWRTKWYQQFPETQNKILLCLPARITRWKGQIDFIKLIAKISQNQPHVQGLIVGETKQGKEKFLDELTALTEELGVSDKLTFTGHRSDLKEIMSLSDVVLSLSTQPEAFGRTVIEALSLGKPVLGYAHGGVEEQLNAVFPEGKIPPGDIEAACHQLSNWFDLMPVVPEHHPFTLHNMLDNTLQIYKEVLAS